MPAFSRFADKVSQKSTPSAANKRDAALKEWNKISATPGSVRTNSVAGSRIVSSKYNTPKKNPIVCAPGLNGKDSQAKQVAVGSGNCENLGQAPAVPNEGISSRPSRVKPSFSDPGKRGCTMKTLSGSQTGIGSTTRRLSAVVTGERTLKHATKASKVQTLLKRSHERRKSPDIPKHRAFKASGPADGEQTAASVLGTSSYWLTQITIAELEERHDISMGFFRLAVGACAQLHTDLFDVLKSYMQKHPQDSCSYSETMLMYEELCGSASNNMTHNIWSASKEQAYACAIGADNSTADNSGPGTGCHGSSIIDILSVHDLNHVKNSGPLDGILYGVTSSSAKTTSEKVVLAGDCCSLDRGHNAELLSSDCSIQENCRVGLMKDNHDTEYIEPAAEEAKYGKNEPQRAGISSISTDDGPSVAVCKDPLEKSTVVQARRSNFSSSAIRVEEPRLAIDSDITIKTHVKVPLVGDSAQIQMENAKSHRSRSHVSYSAQPDIESDILEHSDVVPGMTDAVCQSRGDTLQDSHLRTVQSGDGNLDTASPAALPKFRQLGSKASTILPEPSSKWDGFDADMGSVRTYEDSGSIQAKTAVSERADELKDVLRCVDGTSVSLTNGGLPVVFHLSFSRKENKPKRGVHFNDVPIILRTPSPRVSTRGAARTRPNDISACSKKEKGRRSKSTPYKEVLEVTATDMPKVILEQVGIQQLIERQVSSCSISAEGPGSEAIVEGYVLPNSGKEMRPEDAGKAHKEGIQTLNNLQATGTVSGENEHSVVSTCSPHMSESSCLLEMPNCKDLESGQAPVCGKQSGRSRTEKQGQKQGGKKRDTSSDDETRSGSFYMSNVGTPGSVRRSARLREAAESGITQPSGGLSPAALTPASARKRSARGNVTRTASMQAVSTPVGLTTIS